MTFKLGDIVTLKSGGPKMTIGEIVGVNGNANCTWFFIIKTDSDLKYDGPFSANFNIAQLELV